MERTTWMTEERTAASATGAPWLGRGAAAPATPADLQIRKQRAFVPAAYGPGVVCGRSTSVTSTTNHVDMGRTALDGSPLGSSGAGHG